MVDGDDTTESATPPAADTIEDLDPEDSRSDGSDSSDGTCFEYPYLRPTSRLSVWLEHDFSSRLMSEKPFEECPNPVALRVCRESRILFLQRHRLIQHPMLIRAAFYLHPRTDILCLLRDVDREHLEEVQKHYGAQLEAFQIILVEEIN